MLRFSSTVIDLLVSRFVYILTAFVELNKGDISSRYRKEQRGISVH